VFALELGCGIFDKLRPKGDASTATLKNSGYYKLIVTSFIVNGGYLLSNFAAHRIHNVALESILRKPDP
jgi:hypothetical protein